MIGVEGLAVGDGWVDPGTWADVRFPYDGTVFGSSPVGTVEHAEQALAAAGAARAGAAALPTHRRAAILRGAREQLEREADAVLELILMETAKPIADCRTELARTILALDLSAEEARRIHGETVPVDLLPSGEGLLAFWQRRPAGVVVGITGFNYPLMLAAHKAGPAVAAGCPVILKPSPRTPLSALYLARVLRENGAPPAMVQALTGDADVGERLVRDDRVAAVSFTGSAAVGHAIARAAAGKKVILELGSNAALVVAEDADLDAAARACVRGGFYASGQACISVQRVIVVEAVRDAFLARLAPLVAGLRAGDPREEGTSVGPLIDEGSARRAHEWVEEAVGAGARVVQGGGRSGSLLEPTVLGDVPGGLRAWDEEIFAPVVAVRAAKTFDEALDMVNDSRYGLHASVFTASLAYALKAAERIEAGGVLINEVPGFRADNMPYGGVKASGYGREGPRFVVEELTVTRMVIIRPEPL